MSYNLKCRNCHEILEKCTCDDKKIRKFSPEENTQAAKLGQSKQNSGVTRRASDKTSDTKTNG